jgi:hypothetical protein
MFEKTKTVKTLTTFAACLMLTLYSYGQDSISGMMSSRSFFIPVEKIIYHRIGETDIPVHVTQYGDNTDLVFVNLHDNETTSVSAGKTILQSGGGLMIRLENRNQRVIRFKYRGQSYSFDPNRMFSDAGLQASMKELGQTSPGALAEVRAFAERILSLIPGEAKCIIALHNNTNEAYSVLSYLPGHERAKDAKEVHHAKNEDPDDIALTTDSLLFEAMKAYGFNSILQDNVNVKKDGSLSVWAGENNRRYINIETEHGKFTQYVRMLEKLMETLNTQRLQS